MINQERRRSSESAPARASLWQRLRTYVSALGRRSGRESGVAATLHVEAALREREQQYRSVFESVSDGLFINDMEGRLVDFNPAAARMHGYTPEEFRQLQPAQFIHPDSLHLFADYMAAVRAGSTYRTRAFDLRKDGTAFAVEVLGALFSYHGQPHTLAVVRDVTEQVRVEQLLEQRIQERTRELSTLIEMEQRRAEQFRVIGRVGRQITSILATGELLNQTARLVREKFGYYHVHIAMIEGDKVVFKTAGAGPLDDARFQACESLRLRVGQEGLVGWAAATGEPLVVQDVEHDPRFVASRDDRTRAELVLPIKVKGQVIGVLDVESDRTNAFDETDLAVLQSLADQVAVAMENARFYEQAGRLAALEERQRLARELHDSVSQALYGIGLGARTARALLDRGLAGGDLTSALAEPLDYVLALADAGLAEMRALIFELRPDSLEKEGIIAALTKQAAALQARHKLHVHTDLCAEPPLSFEAKEALYRITQEALTNTVKHARAGRVTIRLHQEADAVVLEVQDDGEGFDPHVDYPGHLGLHSMRERAERLAGSLDIQSEPDRGTRLRASIPVPAAPEDAIATNELHG